MPTKAQVQDVLIQRFLATPEFAGIAENMPIRRDIVVMIKYVQENKVIATAARGNFPRKAIQEISARFVSPLSMEQVRTEEDVWPLYLRHCIAGVGGMMTGKKGKPFAVTRLGKTLLDTPPLIQVITLLSGWWHRVNWLIAFPFSGMGGKLPAGFPQKTLKLLLDQPTDKWISAEAFADQLILQAGLRWKSPEIPSAQSSLHTSIYRMVLDRLEDFAGVEFIYRDEKIGPFTFQKLDQFKITPFGRALLELLEAI